MLRLRWPAGRRGPGRRGRAGGRERGSAGPRRRRRSSHVCPAGASFAVAVAVASVSLWPGAGGSRCGWLTGPPGARGRSPARRRPGDRRSAPQLCGLPPSSSPRSLARSLARARPGSGRSCRAGPGAALLWPAGLPAGGAAWGAIWGAPSDGTSPPSFLGGRGLSGPAPGPVGVPGGDRALSPGPGRALRSPQLSSPPGACPCVCSAGTREARPGPARPGCCFHVARAAPSAPAQAGREFAGLPEAIFPRRVSASPGTFSAPGKPGRRAGRQSAVRAGGEASRPLSH